VFLWVERFEKEDWFESKVCVIFFKGFESDGGVNLRVNFVKVCVRFEWCV